MVELNAWENLFLQMIGIMEFSLNKYEDGYGIIDLQDGDFGDIEGDRFENAMGILDRLDPYIHDYIIEDLEDGLRDRDVEVKYNDYKELLELCRKHIGGEYDFDIDLLDMILNHFDDIDIEKVYLFFLKKMVYI